MKTQQMENIMNEEELALQVELSNRPVVEEYSYPIKNVELNTCASLYESWSDRKRMYARASTGISMFVEYADTIERCPQPDLAPIILALHGAPGTHEDYRPFIEHYAKRNVRIIVPNFPGKLSISQFSSFLLILNFQCLIFRLSHYYSDQSFSTFSS